MTNPEGESQVPKTYMEEGRYPKEGDRALVVKLGSEAGIIVTPEHFDVRRQGASGTVRGYVAGHGGDVWWVHHDESSEIGAYGIDEIAQISRDLGPVNPEADSEE